MGGTPRTTITALEDVPNIGPSIADDLRSIGIKSPHMLRGKNAVELYERLNRHVGAEILRNSDCRACCHCLPDGTLHKVRCDAPVHKFSRLRSNTVAQQRCIRSPVPII
jgi:hypothetical protein